MKEVRALTPQKVGILSLGGLGLASVTCVLALMVGPVPIGPERLLEVLVLGQSLNPEERLILLEVRLPRVVLTAVVGMALSISGAVLQALLVNPLAEPFVLGISSGAALGALGSLLLGTDYMGLAPPVAAFLGAVGTVALVLTISGWRGRLDMTRLLLTGVIVNAFFTSIIMLLLTLSRLHEIHSMLFWLYGDLSGASYQRTLIAAAVSLGCLVVVFGQSRNLNLLSGGEHSALQLGVQVEATKAILLGVASILTAVAVSVSGLIGFVGLIVPHLMRMTVGADHRLLVPMAGFGGAIFLVLADVLARTIASPAEVPVGVVTAALGAPFFVFLLRRHRRTDWSIH